MMAPVINVDQVSEGSYQQVFVPQMMPWGFVAAPEFCEGMWVPPLGGYEAAWPQGGNRSPLQKRQSRHNRNSSSPAMAPQLQPTMVPTFQDPSCGPIFPKQSFSPEEPAMVELSSLPKMLCNRACLEAAIEQAGLEGDVQNLELMNASAGTAMVYLTNEQAAQRCIRHFHGLQWAKSSQPVSAHFCPRAAKPSAAEQQQHQPRTPEPLATPPATPKPMENDTPKKAAELLMSPATTITMSPKSSINSSPNLKPRWADLDSDDEDDDCFSKSTRTGAWDSVPGSSDSDA